VEPFKALFNGASLLQPSNLFAMDNEANLFTMSRHVVPTIAERTMCFPELVLMFAQRKVCPRPSFPRTLPDAIQPEKVCANCAKKGCNCTFDGWSNDCRECCLSMTKGCTFSSLWEWHEFVREDDKKTKAYLGAFLPLF
jgi:hypothetical protein